MTDDSTFESLKKRNDDIIAELISGSRKTERLVEASEELFERRERLRARLAKVTVSAKISPNLGVVKVSMDRRITIDLDHSRVATSDVSRLGDRILASLTAAERRLDEITAKALSKTAEHS